MTLRAFGRPCSLPSDGVTTPPAGKPPGPGPSGGHEKHPGLAAARLTFVFQLGFYAVVPNTQYTIQIRTEVTVGSRNVVDPASGRLVGSASGTLADAGYNTVKLPEAARVTANRPFSVIVKLHTPGNQQPIPIETDKFAYRSRDATSAPGQSFISADGLIWKDAAYIPGTDGTDGISFNVNLKAFAVR